MKYVTLVVIPENAGNTKTFKVPRFVPKLGLVVSLVCLYLVVFLGLDYIDLRFVAQEHRKLVAEHEGLKNEAHALGEKLGEVRRALKVVRNYTAKLDEFTQISTKKINNRTGIGPLSPEEFASTSARLPQPVKSESIPVGVSIDDLTLSPILKQLTEIHSQAHRSTYDMQRLLAKLGKKKSLLSSIPSISPVKGWVTSSYGFRISPFTGEKTRHRGIDIASSIGTPIIAPADGVVIFSGQKEDFGNFIMIAHGYGVVTRYGHNAHNLVQPGQKVKRGDQIATVGASGRTTGPHLHYEVWVNGRSANPKEFILGRGEQRIF